MFFHHILYRGKTQRRIEKFPRQSYLRVPLNLLIVGLNVHNNIVHGHFVHAILSTVRMTLDQNVHSQIDLRPKCPESD